MELAVDAKSELVPATVAVVYVNTKRVVATKERVAAKWGATRRADANDARRAAAMPYPRCVD